MDTSHGRRVGAMPLLLLAFASLPLLSACAIAHERNTRALNALDERIQPESAAARVSLAPLIVPLGHAALLADAFVVNPALAFRPAADDVYEIYWKPREMKPLTRAMLFIPSVILTPPTYVISWTVHAFFESDGEGKS